jgi:hypothetical protein
MKNAILPADGADRTGDAALSIAPGLSAEVKRADSGATDAEMGLTAHLESHSRPKKITKIGALWAFWHQKPASSIIIDMPLGIAPSRHAAAPVLERDRDHVSQFAVRSPILLEVRPKMSLFQQIRRRPITARNRLALCW